MPKKKLTGWEAEAEDGQGQAVAAVDAYNQADNKPIGPEAAARLHADLRPGVRRVEAEIFQNEATEDKAAEVLVAAIELAALPKSQRALKKMRRVAREYAKARGFKVL